MTDDPRFARLTYGGSFGGDYWEIYGPDNPWVRWLEARDPALLVLTPPELRSVMKGGKGPRDWEMRRARADATRSTAARAAALRRDIAAVMVRQATARADLRRLRHELRRVTDSPARGKVSRRSDHKVTPHAAPDGL